MTTARNSWGNRLVVAGALGLTALAGASASAHRLDEYLQAARIGIDPDRIEIELDLTPGVAIAPALLSEIDRDRDGSFSAGEAEAYAARVLNDLHLDVDSRTLPLTLIDRQFPSVESIRGGLGVITLHVVAALPRLQAGTHHLLYRNDHHPDIGVYLANALVPVNDRVAVRSQTRDANQRQLVIEYTLHTDAALVRWWVFGGVAGAAVAGGWFWRRKQRL